MKEFLESQAGGIVVLFILILLFYPMAIKNDSKGWEVVWFLLGGLTTLIKDKLIHGSDNSDPNPPTPPNPPAPPDIRNELRDIQQTLNAGEPNK